MDLLDRLLGHDAWTTRQLLLCSGELTDELLDTPLDMGHGTVRKTFLHLVRNVEVWSDLMSGNEIRPDGGVTPAGRSIIGLMSRLERAAADLATIARNVARRDGWDERWVDHLDSPRTEKTYGGGIAHILTHSMHHRAQLLYMLRRLGLTGLPEGDVLSWEHRRDEGQAPPA